MTVGVRAKKYPLSNSYNTSIDEKQRQVKANMSNPHSEYDEDDLSMGNEDCQPSGRE
jgi:hypothetical protein